LRGYINLHRNTFIAKSFLFGRLNRLAQNEKKLFYKILKFKKLQRKINNFSFDKLYRKNFLNLQLLAHLKLFNFFLIPYPLREKFYYYKYLLTQTVRKFIGLNQYIKKMRYFLNKYNYYYLCEVNSTAGSYLKSFIEKNFSSLIIDYPKNDTKILKELIEKFKEKFKEKRIISYLIRILKFNKKIKIEFDAKKNLKNYSSNFKEKL
jgi:hypothetical protein